MVKIASNGGIGNRLRTMIGYASVYKALGKPLPCFVWKHTRHCPPNDGTFLIDGSGIVDVEQTDDETVMVPGTIDVALMHRTHDLPNPGREAVLDAYGMIGFCEEVRANSTVVFDVAVHLRMGDMASENRFGRFREWMVSNCQNIMIYLACDEQTTIRRLERELTVINYSGFHDRPGSLRKTTTRDAAVDMLTCINAKRFIGTAESSFSQMIGNIRQFQGKTGHLMI